MPSLPLGTLAAILIVLCCGVSSYGLAARLVPAAPTAVRLSATVIVAWWLLVVLFHGLAAVGAFDLLASLVVWSSLAAVTLRAGRRRAALQALARLDLRRARAAGRAALSGTTALPTVAAAVVIALHLLRGLVAPPLAWDALTYHLTHAARWVQHGSFATQPAPDAWGYYAFFPYAGEILWAWAMLPLHGDALLACAETLVVVTVGLATCAAARAIAVRRERALLVALAVVATPAVLAFTITAYVDNVALACFALTILFLARAAVDPRLPELALCAAAAGLGAAVKPSGLPVFAVTVVALAAMTVARRRERPGALRRVIAAAALGAVPFLLQAGRTWVQTGSPLYPFALDVLGRRVFAGNPQLEQLLAGTLFRGTAAAATPRQLAAALFLPAGDGMPHLNFGPGGIVLIGLGVIGLGGLAARRPTRALAAFLAAIGVVTVAMLLSPRAAGLLHWPEVSGRLLAPALLSLALAAATVLPGPRADRLWQIVVLVSLWCSLPRGISSAEATAMAALCALAVLAGCGVALAGRALRQKRGRRIGTAAAALAGLLVLALGVDMARRAVRHRAYDAASSGASFVLRPLHPVYAASAPLWDRLEDMPGQRLAVASGWDGIGHNAYLYPLFGPRLQHEVLYVTPTCSGEIIDYQRRAALAAAADLHCWLRRLLDANVDLVVTLAPRNTPERAWIDAHPELFDPFADVGTNDSRAVRVNREAVRRRLNGGGE